MPTERTTPSRREELIAAVANVGVPEAVRRIKSVVHETTQHWAVVVSRNGEEVLTIESNCLSGREISEEDEKVIQLAARHLLGFIGGTYERNRSD